MNLQNGGIEIGYDPKVKTLVEPVIIYFNFYYFL